jgi:hypothetical protein
VHTESDGEMVPRLIHVDKVCCDKFIDAWNLNVKESMCIASE